MPKPDPEFLWSFHATYAGRQFRTEEAESAHWRERHFRCILATGFQALARRRENHDRVHAFSRFSEMETPANRSGEHGTEQIQDSEMLPPDFDRHPSLHLLLKRLMDLSIALPLCICLLPVFALIAIAIKLDSRGPVFFIQERRGKRFRVIRVIKFRTLRHAAPDPHARYEMLETDPRITRVGSFLRRTSLDELPQLLTVIRGTLSLVGPRPLVEWESRDCLAKHAERFQVKPGITGLSQVAVRNSADFFARLDKDVEYVHRWTLALDLRILAETPRLLVRGTGIYPEPSNKGAEPLR
jgi:lipopolysaccharide/colanic/teichoic acid biosynthesis glycosyltransferase